MRNIWMLGVSIAVLALSGCGGSVNTGNGRLRAIDAYTDSAIDVSTDLAPIGSALLVGDDTGYASVGSGATDVIMLLAGTNTVLATNNLTIDQDLHYTAIPYKTAGGSGAAAVAIFNDDTANPAVGQWKLRFIHMDRTQGQNLDVYVTTPLADINTATPVITNVSFTNAGGYVTLATTGNPTLLRTTIAGTKTIVGSGVTLTPVSGEIKSLIAMSNSGSQNYIYNDINN